MSVLNKNYYDRINILESWVIKINGYLLRISMFRRLKEGKEILNLIYRVFFWCLGYVDMLCVFLNEECYSIKIIFLYFWE